jgi:hypothetical protein
MKKLLALILVAGSASVCHAQLMSTNTSQQEVPPNSDSATYVTASSDTLSLSGTVLTVTSGSFFNLFGQPTTIAVEDGPPGMPGTVLFTLSDSGSAGYVFPEGGGLYFGTFTGAGSLTPSEVTDLNNGDLFVNISTTTESSMNGEVRGQITSVPEPATMTLMGVGALAWLAKRRQKA